MKQLFILTNILFLTISVFEVQNTDIKRQSCQGKFHKQYVWSPRETTALSGFFKNELAIVY